MTDSANQTATSTVAVTVTANSVNQAPTLEGSLGDRTFGADGGSVLLADLVASDPDGTEPTLGVRLADGGALPEGIVIEAGSLVIPAGLSVGALALEVFADDGALQSAPVSLTVTIGEAADSAPSAPTLADAAVDENAQGAVVGALVSADPEGGDVVFSVPDASDFEVVEGTLKLKDDASLDHEAADSVTVAVTATDPGGNSVTADIVVAVNDVDEAPSSVTIDGGQVDENAAGAVVGSLAATDPEGETATFSVDAGSDFEIVDGNQLKLKDGIALDYEAAASVSVDVTATDPAGNATTTTLAIAVNDVPEDGPFNVLFDAASITAYNAGQDQPQDGGSVAVSVDRSAVTLDGNFWKRAPLGDSYSITENTKLVVVIETGSAQPEIVGIGFDDDDNPFETSDRSIYQVDGTQTQASFVDLRGAGEDLGNGKVQFTIDLSAKAGTVVNSIVLVSDDDRFSDGRGSATFSNVSLLESEAIPPATGRRGKSAAASATSPWPRAAPSRWTFRSSTTTATR